MDPNRLMANGSTNPAIRPDGEARADAPHDVVVQIVTQLCQCWSSTGFGEIRIESERIKGDKIRVIVRAGTHRRFIISDKDVCTM